MDEKELKQKLDEYNGMLVQIGAQMTFISPREIPEDLKESIIELIKYPVKFIQDIKPSTSALMVEIFRASGTPVSAKNFLITGRQLTIFLKSEDVLSTMETLVKALKTCVENDGFIDVLVFNIDDEAQVFNLGGKPITLEPGRLESITPEDIMDLRITLETSLDVNDIINSL